MEFVFMTEVAREDPVSYYQRYWEVLDEAVYAEELGFSTLLVSEHHFLETLATISALETYLGALAMRTERIRLRPATFVLPLGHPIRVTEQVATLDILSKGRIEIGAGRGNYLKEMEAFEIPATDTRARWQECLEIIVNTLANGEFEHEGRFYNIPKRPLVPSPVQTPHPPVWTAATSFEGSYLAGKMGLGVMHLSNYLGFDFVAEVMKHHRRGLQENQPLVRKKNERFSVLALSHCADTWKQAWDEAGEGIITFSVATCQIVYPQLAKASADYRYMAKAEKLGDKVKDPEFLVNESAIVIAGDPDDCVRQLNRFVELGVDEVILKIDGMSHDTIMRSMKLFSEEVIPRVNGSAAQKEAVVAAATS